MIIDEIPWNNVDTFSSTRDYNYNKGNKTIKVNDHDDDLDLSRISVRPYNLSDVDDFMLWARDPEVSRFSNWEFPMSKEHGTKLVELRMFDHPWYKSICVDHRSIGEISVSSRDTCRAEIGYALRRDYRGKGIVTHVVKLVSKCVFIDYPIKNLERLEAIVDIENLASQRVVEKAGFVREGVLRKYYVHNGKSRDMIMYSLLSSECVCTMDE